MKVKMPVDDAIKAVKELHKKVKNNYLRQATRDACKVGQQAVIAATPVKSGQAARAWKVRAGKRRKNKVSAMITAGAGFFKGITYYLGFLIYGHRQGKKELGEARKLIPGNNFAKKAWEANQGAIVSAFTSKLKSLLASGGTKK